MELSDRELKVLKYLRDHEYISKIGAIHEALDVSEEEIVRILMRLFTNGLIGNVRNTFILLPLGLKALHEHERSQYVSNFKLSTSEARSLFGEGAESAFYIS